MKKKGKKTSLATSATIFLYLIFIVIGYASTFFIIFNYFLISIVILRFSYFILNIIIIILLI